MLLEFLYAALASERGIVLSTSGGFEPTRQKLYAARREAGDPDLDLLSIAASPTNPEEIWIVKRAE